MSIQELTGKVTSSHRDLITKVCTSCQKNNHPPKKNPRTKEVRIVVRGQRFSLVLVPEK